MPSNKPLVAHVDLAYALGMDHIRPSGRGVAWCLALSAVCFLAYVLFQAGRRSADRSDRQTHAATVKQLEVIAAKSLHLGMTLDDTDHALKANHLTLDRSSRDVNTAVHYYGSVGLSRPFLAVDLKYDRNREYWYVTGWSVGELKEGDPPTWILRPLADDASQPVNTPTEREDRESSAIRPHEWIGQPLEECERDLRLHMCLCACGASWAKMVNGRSTYVSDLHPSLCISILWDRRNETWTKMVRKIDVTTKND